MCTKEINSSNFTKSFEKFFYVKLDEYYGIEFCKIN